MHTFTQLVSWVFLLTKPVLSHPRLIQFMWISQAVFGSRPALPSVSCSQTNDVTKTGWHPLCTACEGACSTVCRSNLYMPAYARRIRYGSTSGRGSAFHSSTKLTERSTVTNAFLAVTSRWLTRHEDISKAACFTQPVKQSCTTPDILVVSTSQFSIKLNAQRPRLF